MKHLANCLVVTFLISFINLDAQITIGDPISVTSGDNSFSYRTPKVEVNDNGEAVVLWVKPGSSEELFVSRKSGGSFTSPVSVPLGNINPSIWSGNLSPGLAVFENHIYVVFEKYAEAIYISHSSDYGDTWDDPVAAFTPPSGRVATIPNVAVDVDGNPLVSYVNTNESEQDAHYGLVKSEDFGTTFSSEVEVNVLTDGAEVCECCNGDISVSENGDVFVAFRSNNENLRDCWIARSIDGGENFSIVYDMDETDWNANVCPSNGPSLFVDNDQAVLTFFTAAADWDNGVYYTSVDLNSSEIGSTLSVPYTSDNSINQTAPRIAGGGNIFGIVSQETISGVASVVMSISEEGPAGLQEGSFQLFTSNEPQRYPSVALDDNRFHVVYEHSISGTVQYQEVYVGPLSISQFDKIINIAYPNPASDVLYVKGYSKNVDFRIIDNLGRVVMMDATNSNNPISLRNLIDGMYILEIVDFDKVYSQKFVVKH